MQVEESIFFMMCPRQIGMYFFKKWLKSIWKKLIAGAKYLNKQGFLTRNGFPASRQLIEKIIKNPIYCGIIRVWDFEVKGKFDPIIDEKLFYLCQGSRRMKKNKPHTPKNPNFPLRNLAICSYCQNLYTHRTRFTILHKDTKKNHFCGCIFVMLRMLPELTTQK